MESKSLFQLFLGKEDLSKKEFIKAWLGWWVVFIVVVIVVWMLPIHNARFIGYCFAFGFCQITARYVRTMGWSKFWGVLGFFPITNIPFFLFLLFTRKA